MHTYIFSIIVIALLGQTSEGYKYKVQELSTGAKVEYISADQLTVADTVAISTNYKLIK